MLATILPKVHWPTAVLFLIHAGFALFRLYRDPPATARGGRYAPVVDVTLSFVFLLMTFLFRQSATAFGIRFRSVAKDDTPISMTSIKYGNGGGKTMLAANRVVGNTLEQAVPFLLALWLHATFVDCHGAAVLGWCWIASRCLYPVVWGRFPLIFLSTMPGYFFIALLCWPLVRFA